MPRYNLSLTAEERGLLVALLGAACMNDHHRADAAHCHRLLERVERLGENAVVTRRVGEVPPEPPIGTYVRDRFGGVTKRHRNGLWAPPGCAPTARWDAMWAARGPLELCGRDGQPIR